MANGEIIVVALAVGLSFSAILLSLFAADLVRRTQRVVILLAGLALLSVTIFHLGPEVLASGANRIMLLVGGFGLGGLLEFANRTTTKGRPDAGAPVIAKLSLVALAIHSALDGGIYAVTFAHDEVSGLLAGLGLVLHEAPEGAVALVLAMQAGWRTSLAVVVAVAASSFTTPLGWLAGTLLGETAHDVIEPMFAASAGLLAYSGLRLLINASRRAATAEPDGTIFRAGSLGPKGNAGSSNERRD